jgi:hypothetical protein
MADKRPNYLVEIKRLEVEIATLQLNRQRNELRIMELKDEIHRLEENDIASEKAIADYNEKLSLLRAEHLKEK